MSNHQPVLHKLPVLFFGLSFACLIGSQIIGFTQPLGFLFLVYLILFGLGLWIGNFLRRAVLVPGFQHIEPKQRFFWILISILGGAFLIISIPVIPIPQTFTVAITATRQKNAVALGSEVWFAKVNTPSISSLLSCKGDWKLIDGLRVSSGEQTETLSCPVKIDRNVTDRTVMLSFGSHPWSGIALVTYPGGEIIEDLYSTGGANKEIVLNLPYDPAPKTIWFIAVFLDWFAISSLVFIVGVVVLKWSINLLPGAQNIKLPWFLLAAIISLGWIIFWLIYWPGFLSPDSVDQLTQAWTGQINDWHPAFHTLLLQILTRPWSSTLPVVMLHIAVLSALLGWGISQVIESLNRSWIILALTGFYAIWPVSALMALTLWKDVAFTAVLMSITFTFMKIMRKQGSPLKEPRIWLFLGVAGGLAGLFRHNGIFVTFGCFFFLLLCYSRYWKTIIAAILLSLTLWFGVRSILYPWVGISFQGSEQIGESFTSSTTYSLIQFHLISGTSLSTAEQVMVANVQSLAVMVESSDQLKDLSWQLTLKRPFTTLRYFINKGKFIFQVRQPSYSRNEYVTPIVIDNPFGFRSASKLPLLKPYTDTVIYATQSPEWDWLFWRNAAWMDLVLISMVLAGMRFKNWRFILVAIPMLVNLLPYAIFSGGQLARYVLPTLFLGPLLVVYFFSFSYNENNPS